MQYDIMQVEDDFETRGFIESAAKRQELTYHGVSSLQALEDALTHSSARLYIVDGRFPRLDGGAVGFNAPNAIQHIRKTDSDAKIILYSGELSGEAIAKENNVDYCGKLFYTARELVSKIREMIREE